MSKCILCGANEKKRFLMTGGPSLVSCASCSLVSVESAANEENNVSFSKSKYFRITGRKQIAILGKFKNKGRLLDVGQSDGVFFDEAKKRGWDSVGIDISENIAQFREKEFDVVTLWNVLNNLADPLDRLRQIFKLLKEDGVLVIQCPNINSWFAKYFGSEWDWLPNSRSICFFSAYTLTRLIEKAGFDVVQTVGNTPINAVWHNVEKFLGKNIVFKVCFYIISPAIIFLEIILRRFMKSALITMYAKKSVLLARDFEKLSNKYPSIGLAMIVCHKDIELIEEVLKKHEPYFDEVSITIDGHQCAENELIEDIIRRYESGRSQNNRIGKLGKIHVNYRLLNGDFSAQKNFTNSKLSTPWIFSLDADEIVDEDLLKKLRDVISLMQKKGYKTCGFPRKNYVDGKYLDEFYPDYQYRLSAEGIKWVRKIHEVPSLCVKNWKQVWYCEYFGINHYKSMKKVEDEISLFESIKNGAGENLFKIKQYLKTNPT